MKLLGSKSPAVPRMDNSCIDFTATGKATFGGIARVELRIDRDCQLRRGDVLRLELELTPEAGVAGLVVKQATP